MAQIESACNGGDLGLIPGFGRSPGEGKGYPLQYSGLENSMDCIVHGVAELDMTEQLSLSFFTFHSRKGTDFSLDEDPQSRRPIQVDSDQRETQTEIKVIPHRR